MFIFDYKNIFRYFDHLYGIFTLLFTKEVHYLTKVTPLALAKCFSRECFQSGFCCFFRMLIVISPAPDLAVGFLGYFQRLDILQTVKLNHLHSIDYALLQASFAS